MKVLELFSGTGSVGKVCKEKGWEVVSLDLKNADINIDILKWDYKVFAPETFDIIWASPPCTGFSVAAIGRNWEKTETDAIPKTDTARLGIELVRQTIQIIDHFQPKYFFIENPRGMLRTLQIMQRFKRQGVTYCQYGDDKMKPTDIWTNSESWVPRPMCKNGDSCHISAPRGSRTGTQGLANAYERSKIPEQLCLEILNSCI